MNPSAADNLRAERRAAPKPARASRETRLAFVPSKSAQADLEPRHSLPLGERRRACIPRLLGECPPERQPACRPVGRPTYPSGEGLHSLLAVENLGKSFGGVHAIEDLSFNIQSGAVHSIIGPNGAGKTTLLNMLAGLYVPDSGRIRLAGRDLAGEPAHRFAAAGIGRTFQNLQVFFNMTALENVMTGRHLRERCSLLAAMLRTRALVRAEDACREVSRRLLQLVGLADYRDARADAMPYGALKRLEIARALAAEPLLLLLDEPAAGLNPTEAREIDALIKRLAAEGTTVILVEHNMRLVMEVSDHVLVLDHGRKLTEGTPAQIAREPRVIEAYLGIADDDGDNPQGPSAAPPEGDSTVLERPGEGGGFHA